MNKENQITPTGYIEPVIDSSQYILGDGNLIADPVLEEDEDWGEWDFIEDLQSKKFETYNCTGFNTAQAISKIIWRKYGEKFNPSARWIGIIAGTSATKGGNDPHVVAEAIRKNGLIPDEMLPFSDDLETVDEYYSFKGADEAKCRAYAKDWLTKWEFNHDWVVTHFTTDPTAMKYALRYSPLGGDVSAWLTNEQGLYVRFGQSNHWTNIRGYNVNNPKADDSYIPFKKELVPEFGFSFVKRYVVIKKKVLTPELKQNILTVFWELLKRGWLSLFPSFVENYTTQPTNPPTPLPPPEPPKPVSLPKKDYITPMAEAIKLFEGWAAPGEKDRTGKIWPSGTASWRRNNPGNIKSSDGNFIIYTNEKVGFAALVYYIERACTGKHKAYKPEMTIRQFFGVYSPDGNVIESAYASFVCKYMSEKLKEMIYPSKQLKELV